MSKYSILFPPTKFHSIGPFRFPIYKALLPGEQKQIEEITLRDAKTKFGSVQLAKKIAKDKGLKMKEALDLLASMGTTNDLELVYEYIDDIEALNTGGMGEVTQKASLVTLVMRFRGEVKFPEDDDYVPTRDWSETDTEKLPPDVMEEIFQFVVWERDGWPTAEGKSPEPAEESSRPPRATTKAS